MTAIVGRCQIRLSGCPGHDQVHYRAWFDTSQRSSPTACANSKHGWEKTCGPSAEVHYRFVASPPSKKENPKPPPPPLQPPCPPLHRPVETEEQRQRERNQRHRCTLHVDHQSKRASDIGQLLNSTLAGMQFFGCHSQANGLVPTPNLSTICTEMVHAHAHSQLGFVDLNCDRVWTDLLHRSAREHAVNGTVYLVALGLPASKSNLTTWMTPGDPSHQIVRYHKRLTSTFQASLHTDRCPIFVVPTQTDATLLRQQRMCGGKAAVVLAAPELHFMGADPWERLDVQRQCDHIRWFTSWQLVRLGFDVHQMDGDTWFEKLHRDGRGSSLSIPDFSDIHVASLNAGLEDGDRPQRLPRPRNRTIDVRVHTLNLWDAYHHPENAYSCPMQPFKDGCVSIGVPPSPPGAIGICVCSCLVHFRARAATDKWLASMVLFLARDPYVWEQSLANALLTNAMSAGWLTVSWDTPNWAYENGLNTYPSSAPSPLSPSAGGRAFVHHSSDKRLKPRAEGVWLSAADIARWKVRATEKLRKDLKDDFDGRLGAVYAADASWFHL